MSSSLSAKERRNWPQNEQLWQTLEICDLFGPTFGFKFHNNLLNLKNEIAAST